ncbi:MAG: diguanylate cyclase, partial [Armatimonadetes bacterium]|nr:diguanylate cyclase [Armatimonadota bacterium]
MLKKLRIPLACKVFLVCFGVAVVVSVAGSMILYRGASHSLRQEVRGRLQSVAATAALQVDPQLHERVRTSDDESSDAYRKVKAVLGRIRDSNPGLRYVYTMRKTGKKNVWQFVVDAETNPKDMSHVGDEYEVGEYPQMMKAFEDPIADQDPAEDQWGTWLSGYAPIKDAKGRAVAIIGMDLSLAQLQLEEASLRRAMLDNTLAAILLSILLGLLFTKALLRPIQALNRAADRVRQGDLAFQLGLNGRDELGDLARSFDSMIVALTEQTTRDFLTGLFNYMYFREALTIEVERAARCERQFCLLIFDLDRFKSVNDSLGHLVGNSILHQLGDVLRANLRAADIPARYGGDEFVIILPNTDEAAGVEVAERIRAAVESHVFHAVALDRILSKDFVGDDNAALHVTVSVGLACYPKHHKLRDGLVMAADIALCRAKNVARNSVHVYDSAADERSRMDPQDLYEVLYSPNSSAIQSLAAAVDAKDRYTCGHSERVAGYAMT